MANRDNYSHPELAERERDREREKRQIERDRHRQIWKLSI